MIRTAFAFMSLPTAVLAGDLIVKNPMVPLAPPSAMAHAAYFTLTNTGDETRQLIGVRADDYVTARIHKTEEKDGVSSMIPVDLIEIAPGQSLVFEQGALHVMLMRPEAVLKEGAKVDLSLVFADGEILFIAADVMPVKAMHEHGS